MSIATTPSSALVTMLNQLLAELIDYHLQVKQAHWHIRGPNFIALHEFLDKVAEQVSQTADEIAERIVQLGELAKGTLQHVQQATALPPYPVDLHDSQQHIVLLGQAITAIMQRMAQVIEHAEQVPDVVTVDILTTIVGQFAKLRWLISAHHAAV